MHILHNWDITKAILHTEIVSNIFHSISFSILFNNKHFPRYWNLCFKSFMFDMAKWNYMKVYMVIISWHLGYPCFPFLLVCHIISWGSLLFLFLILLFPCSPPLQLRLDMSVRRYAAPETRQWNSVTGSVHWQAYNIQSFRGWATLRSILQSNFKQNF